MSTSMTAMETVLIARSVNRPRTSDIIEYLFTDFIEFHGDRNYKDDKAIIGGIAFLDDMPVTVIGTQKGNTVQDNVYRNFGSPHPEGYRKALRLMQQAEKFNRPIINFINVSGAYCGIGAEERGQGEAIARNLYEMSTLKVPVISVIVGEGGSGGALALAVADKLYMFDNAIYSILSPEGFASILWKDSSRSVEAAELMKLTAKDLQKSGIIETIIPEVEGGFQNNLSFSLNILKENLTKDLNYLNSLDKVTLTANRYERFRKFGEFEERGTI